MLYMVCDDGQAIAGCFAIVHTFWKLKTQRQEGVA